MRAASANAWTGVQLLSVLFVAVLTAAGAQLSFPLPFTPVPFTIQPMIVLIGAAALGSRLGALSQIIYLMLGIAGFQVFAYSPELPQGFAAQHHGAMAANRFSEGMDAGKAGLLQPKVLNQAFAALPRSKASVRTVSAMAPP